MGSSVFLCLLKAFPFSPDSDCFRVSVHSLPVLMGGNADDARKRRFLTFILVRGRDVHYLRRNRLGSAFILIRGRNGSFHGMAEVSQRRGLGTGDAGIAGRYWPVSDCRPEIFHIP